MGFAGAVRTCLSKYVTFSGRARRPEYWWFVLAVVLASAVASILDALLFGAGVETTTGPGMAAVDVALDFTPITNLVGLGAFLPLLAAGWRRLHDVGRPGWVMFLPHAASLVGILLGMIGALATGTGSPTVDESLMLVTHAPLGAIPLLLGVLASLGLAIWLFVQLVSGSQPGPNRFGPEPVA